MLVERNLPLVIHLAKGYRGRGLGFDDLIAAGNLGLVRAADHYDPGRPGRFVRCAVIWIREAIEHALVADEPIHLSITGNKMYRRVASYLDCCDERREPPDFNLLRAVTYPQSTSANENAHIALQDQTLAAFLRRHSGRRVPLPEDDRSLAAGDPDPDVSRSERKEVYEVIRSTIDALDAPMRDREVLKYRLGLYGSEPWSRTEVGREFGVSSEWIRRIELKYLDEVRAFVAERLGLEVAEKKPRPHS